eukprot:gene9010-9974_t
MELQKDVSDILITAKKNGLSRHDLMDILGLPAEDDGVHESRNGFKSMHKLSCLVLFFALLWVCIFGFTGPAGIKKKFNEVFDKSTSCAVDQVEASLEFTRPLSNCALMCEGLTEVPRYETITQKEFLERFAYTGRPLVVTGMTKNWTALQVFNFEYLKKLYSSFDDAFDVQDENCQFFPYKTNFGSLEDAFKMSKKNSQLKGKTWYIGWSNCHTKVMKEIRKHYQKPEFLPSDSETSQQDWIFMGGSGPGAPVHIDTVDRPSWQAQISGKKSWSLIPPAECGSVCNSLNVTMNTGDIVVVDTNQWFHSTYVHPGKMSITIGAEFD